jgi:hypothetical protein
MTIFTRALACWLLLAGAGACGAAEYLPGANLFGAFTSESQDGLSGCASLDVQDLRPGTPVDVVVLSTPQRLLRGAIVSRATAQCSRYFQASQATAFYDVAIRQGRFRPDELGVAVLPGVSLAQTKKGAPVVAQFRRGRYGFFECSSSEGVHIVVRSAGNQGSTIWHDYIYLAIDVDPTCRKPDYAGIASLRERLQGGARTRSSR